MSVIALAELLDQLKAEEPAFLIETADTVTVSSLQLADARAVLGASDAAGCQARVFDGANTPWERHELDEHIAPFRIVISKPQPAAGGLQILTNIALKAFLKTGTPHTIWNVARLRTDILTQGRLLRPWESNVAFQPSLATKSPRQLVREYGAERSVPKDIRPWLMTDIKGIRLNDPAFKVWADASIRALVLALPDEIEVDTGRLKFKGPPRLALTPPDAYDDSADAIGAEAFKELQETVAWVFENEREAEQRHIFLSNELARSAGNTDSTLNCIKDHVSAAHEGARVAYQMSVSEVSRDTLKALGDLRKSVTDDIVKVNDTTRQLITSLAGAIAVGIGLIVARFTTSMDANLLRWVMAVVVVYVVSICFSGVQFILLQRTLRKEWQAKLYRFLPAKEFKEMVTAPTGTAEKTFFWVSGVSCLAVFGLAYAIFTTQTPNPPPLPSPAPAQQSGASPAVPVIPTAAVPATPSKTP
ncbi:hypothetical protein FNB15_03560 [Ferrovibrio terrae]|uniref:Transmembrane protein n=1 Tax=Ferrovibrio terrae TaxID=2594003 RepID=A0A516GY05_9PROT|nr:hypothetical protein [Ferrovibrio terrae]QDO96411.1 hypothetical protein FNB15_03560 [Ferrovibrio terrae]